MLQQPSNFIKTRVLFSITGHVEHKLIQGTGHTFLLSEKTNILTFKPANKSKEAVDG